MTNSPLKKIISKLTRLLSFPIRWLKFTWREELNRGSAIRNDVIRDRSETHDSRYSLSEVNANSWAVGPSTGKS